MIIIISNNLEILLQENLKRPPISWSANHVLSYENDFFFKPICHSICPFNDWWIPTN